MKRKLARPSAREDKAIAVAIASDPDAAPDLSRGITGLRLLPGRPKAARTKKAVSIRLDEDVLAYFRKSGPGWQSRINLVLRRSAKLSSVRS